jgi:hypothetical protein
VILHTSWKARIFDKFPYWAGRRWRFTEIPFHGNCITNADPIDLATFRRRIRPVYDETADRALGSWHPVG